MGPGPEEEQTEPPASVLTRRRALVPPKIPPYNVDSSEDAEQSVDKETSTRYEKFLDHVVIVPCPISSGASNSSEALFVLSRIARCALLVRVRFYFSRPSFMRN